MALPTAQKSWQYDVNNLIAETTIAAYSASTLWTIKNALVTFDSNPWTVAGSSDSAGSFGMDGVDRWTSSSSLRWASSGNISWIVLEQSGIDGYFQLLISCNTANAYNINMSFSKGGLYTGGSATAPPTAADAITLKNAAAWGPQTNSTVSSMSVHVMQSDDGECTRVFIHRADHNSSSTFSNHNIILSGVWIFDKIYNPSNGWATPYICGVVANSTTNTDIGYVSNFGAVFSGVHNSITMAISPTWEGTYTASSFSTIMYSQNKISNNYTFFPIGIASLTTNARGRHGQIYDLWWGNVYLTDGYKYTDGASNNNFVKVGCFIIPWPNNVDYIRA